LKSEWLAHPICGIILSAQYIPSILKGNISGHR
jgi:hypothetical protein